MGGEDSAEWKVYTETLADELQDDTVVAGVDLASPRNNQVRFMVKLKNELTHLMALANNLGVHCFATVVTGEATNVAAHRENMVLYNNDTVKSFLTTKFDLKRLHEDFFVYILKNTGHVDEAVKNRLDNMQRQRAKDLHNRESVRSAVTTTLLSLIKPSIKQIPWRSLGGLLIKRQLVLRNCPPEMKIFMSLNSDAGQKSHWQRLYEALGGESPVERYDEYTRDPSRRYIDLVPWSDKDKLCDPSSDQYQDIVLIRTRAGTSADSAPVMLTVRGVTRKGKLMEGLEAAWQEDSYQMGVARDSGRTKRCTSTNTSLVTSSRNLSSIIPGSAIDFGMFTLACLLNALTPLHVNSLSIDLSSSNPSVNNLLHSTVLPTGNFPNFGGFDTAATLGTTSPASQFVDVQSTGLGDMGIGEEGHDLFSNDIPIGGNTVLSEMDWGASHSMLAELYNNEL